MFTLILERGSYIRVRGNVKKCDIEREFSFSVNAEVFEGAIIAVLPQPQGYCYARPCDSYASIAEREGVGEEELKKLHSDEIEGDGISMYDEYPPDSR